MCLVHFCMNQIHTATLLPSVALLSLAQLEYCALSPLDHLPDPAMAMASSAVTFSNFVCCGCYDRGPGSLSLFPCARLSPHTFCAARYVSERGRARGLSLCSTDRLQGPRITRLEPLDQQGPGQCNPQRQQRLQASFRTALYRTRHRRYIS